VLGLPRAGEWAELFNSNAQQYGGSGVGNIGAVTATDEGWNHLPAQALLTLPPLAVTYLYQAT
jgi:1,4-alpha-glucan branching enzyme